MTSRLIPWLTATLVVGGLAVVAPQRSAFAQTACTKYASQGGQDTNAGTELAPYLTVTKLFQSLAPGQTGCLRGGDTFTELINMSWSGSAGQPITLQSYGVGRAEFIGQIHVLATTHHVTFRNLRFGGLPIALKATHLNIDGDYVEIRDSEITNPWGICIDVGAMNAKQGIDPGNPALGFVLDNNRIHDCGNSPSVVWDTSPGSVDSGAHGVYLVNPIGAEISNNIIYDNKYRGLQTWPKAEQTNIHHNVFDGSATNLNIGSALTDDPPQPWHSINTIASNNIITNATLWNPDKNGAQVVGNFPIGSPTYGNSVTGNCVYHVDPTKNFAGNGFVQSGNTIADPLYVNRAAKDFRLSASSPCVGKGPASIQPVGQTPTNVVLSIPAAQTANVMWTAPTNTAGIQYYRVALTPTGGGAPVYQWAVAPATTLQMYGMAAGSYSATVQSYTAAGLSPGSLPSTTQSVLGVPSAPTGLVATSPSTGTISLNWTSGFFGGEARPYSYTMLQNNTTGSASNLWAAGETSANLYGLPGGSYTVATSQYGATAGLGARSLRGTVTVVGLPPVPQTVTSSAQGVNGANVSWTASASNGGAPILYYRVTLSTGASTAAPVVSWVPASQTSVVVPNLPAGTWTVGVSAYSSAGIGPAAFSPTSVTSTGGTAASTIPAPVSSVTATVGAANGQVTVNFTLPVPYNSGSAAVAYFRVALQHGGGGEGPHFQWVPATARSATFYGFPGGGAKAQVVAYNANGEFGAESQWSPNIIPLTISYLAPYSLSTAQPNSIGWVSGIPGGNSTSLVRVLATPVSATGTVLGAPFVGYILGNSGGTVYGIPTGRYSVMVEPYNVNGFGWSEDPEIVTVT
jgi:Fibronectin type III domain/Right handed beta helix region